MRDYDLAIIGGGPAGLAAACYGLQAQLQVALISPTLGGKVSYPFQVRGLPAVESVWGADLVQQLAAFAEARLSDLYHQEVKQVIREADGTFRIVLGNAEQLHARAVIVCTGAQPQRLYVPGEHEFLGCGVSFSAISHAQFFRKRSVAVVGGERALPAVLKLANIASQVYYVLAHPRSLGNSPIVEAVLSHPKVIVLQDWEVQRIVGEQFVTGLALVGANGEVRTIPVEGVFVEFGLLPNIEMVRGLVDLDEEGRIMINQHCETSTPGLFAAGDVTNVHAEQVPVAIGEGVKAALSAWSYLTMQGIPHLLHLGAAH